MSTSGKVASGAIWMMLLRASVKGLGFISTLVLVRLLTPGDFGVVAIVMAVYALIDLIKQFGFEVAIIQNQQATADHYNTAWTLKVLFGVFAGGIFFVLSPSVSAYYDDPRLLDIARITALMFLLSGLSNIGVVDFIKKFHFKKEFRFRVAIKLLSMSVTLVTAWYTRNYWALVVGMLVSTALEVLLSYVVSSFRPRLCLTEWRSLFGFSGWLMLNNVLRYITHQFSGLMIAKLLSPALVGVFKVTKEFSFLPGSEVVASICKAALPGFASVSHDLKQVKALYQNLQAGIGMTALPLAAMLFAMAEYFIPAFLGPDWLEGINVMRALAGAQIFVCITAGFTYVFMGIGKPRYITFFLAFKSSLLVLLILLFTNDFGLLGAAYAFVCVEVLALPLAYLMINRVFALSVSELFLPVARPLCAVTVTCWFSLWVGNAITIHYRPFEAFFLMGLCVSIVYLMVHGSLWLLHENKSDTREYAIYRMLKARWV